MQLSVVVHPAVLFRHYLYASSASAPQIDHFADYAQEVAERFAPAGSLVVELGSNDGVLLRPLATQGIQVLGIEPATNLAKIANESGLETWDEFFSGDVARKVRATRGPAKAILANNVLAHIDDLHDVVDGLDVLLDRDGVLVAEVPYVGDLLKRVEYDTIYHEHLSYFGLRPLLRLFQDAGFEMFDVRWLAVHGGSIRIFAARTGAYQQTESLRAAIESEQRAGLDDEITYRRFAAEVVASRSTLRGMINELLSRGHTLAALGATAKGNTLLNYCQLDTRQIAYVADSTPLKQGLLTPGTHIPIRPEQVIMSERPEYTLLLAWNYADSILARFTEYIDGGGRFIHPIPTARIIPE